MRHPERALDKRVAVLGCKHTTLELILGLKREGFAIDHCITISPEKGAQQEVAGYQDLRPFLESHRIPFSVAHRYSLKGKRDQAQLLALELDLLLVMGWQRLIPDWWLQGLSVGAFGMHGSSRPLPHGRGRSPMNWSLIQGKDRFYTHLFQYQPGVDDGPIIGVQRFDISAHDDCLTLHHKNTLAMIRLACRHLPALMDGSASRQPQPEGSASYYPRRRPEDGQLFWKEPSEALYNLVRAVTRPFPGAFSFLDDDPQQRVMIWRAIPFDQQLLWPEAQPGEILHVFLDGSFLVRSGDSSLLIQESEGHRFSQQDIGRRFGPAGALIKIWEGLPE